MPSPKEGSNSGWLPQTSLLAPGPENTSRHEFAFSQHKVQCAMLFISQGSEPPTSCPGSGTMHTLEEAMQNCPSSAPRCAMMPLDCTGTFMQICFKIQ